MSGRLDQKIALVTGAAAGIGEAISKTFRTEGARVVGADISKISDTQTFSLTLELDVTKADQWERAVKAVVEKYGRLDILVNCAGVAPQDADPRPIWETEESAWHITNAVNSTGVFLGCKYGTKQMIGQEPLPNGDRGWIVNLSSIFGQVGGPAIVPYVASKHACVGITKGAAMDCAPYRVHVNALCPGFVRTSMTRNALGQEERAERIAAAHPFRGTGETDDIAKAALFLASPENTWMSGSLMTVDGGYTAR